MGMARMVGMVLVAAGALGLAYGGFTYTNVPMIVSAAALALGVILLAALRSK